MPEPTFPPLRRATWTVSCAVMFALAPAAAPAESAGPAALAETASVEQRAAEAARQSGPRSTIAALHEELIEVMKNAERWGYAGREERLAEVLPRFFDVDFMAKKSLGRYWTRSEEADQSRYLATFERFMVANYAGRFDGFSGQSFVTLGEEPAGKGTVMVLTRLNNPSDDDVELKYRLRPVDGGWKIIDVFLDGTVSELALRYSEFVSIVKRDDLEALIAALDERIAKLAAGGEAG